MLVLNESLPLLDANGSIPCLDNVTISLQRCRKEKNLSFAKHLHVDVCAKGLEAHKDIGNYLVPMFVECGSTSIAQQIFNRLIHCNEFSWTSLIEGYIQTGHAEHALNLYQQMQSAEEVRPSRYTYTSLLKACSKVNCLERGREIHVEVVIEGFESDEFIASSLIDMYTKCGLLTDAHDVFEELAIQDVVSWTTLISGYVDHGKPVQALKCFGDMLQKGVAADRVTYIYCLKACAMLKDLEQGRKLHAEIKKQKFKGDGSISNALLDMYMKCDSFTDAQEMLQKHTNKNVELWNVLMAGYVDRGLNEEALSCLNKMKLQGLTPDASTYVSGLKACAGIKNVKKGREIHKEVDKKSLLDPYVCSALVDMYVKCGSLEEAKDTFNDLPFKEVVSWTALIAGYSENGLHETALDCLKQMQLQGIFPDSVTFMYCLNSCGSLGATGIGQELHKKIVEEGYDDDNRLCNALVDMYIKLNLLEEAQDMFDEFEVLDLVCWTSLIASFTEHGRGEEALICYEKMKKKGMHPDPVTYVSILKACSVLGSITHGLIIHAEVVREGLEGDPFIGNSLMDLYMKCSCLPEGWEVFDEMSVQDVVSWTTLIAGCAELGLYEQALELYKDMGLKSVYPNAVTFICILRACSSIVDLAEGRQIHDHIIRVGCEKDLYVGSSLVSLYSKCGALIDAEGVFNALPVQDASSWNSLLLGYIENGLGEEALALCKGIPEEVTFRDPMIYNCILKACSVTEAIDDGHIFHSEIISRGYEQDHFLGSVLVDMYVRCNLVIDAQCIFDKVLVRDAISWNSLITGYIEHGHHEEALQQLEDMLSAGVYPNVSTYGCIIKLFGVVGDIMKGQLWHSEIIKKGHESDQHIASAIVSMYGKFGLLQEGYEVLNKFPEPDIVLWNAIITGYADQGLHEEVTKFLEQMQVQANAVTYMCSLKSCKFVGSVESGYKIHAKIIEEGYENNSLVSSTLVDMYANCGFISHARDVLEELSVDDVFSWTALIAGYAEQGFDEEVLNCFLEMQSNDLLPDDVTIVYCLQACGNLGDLEKVHQMHASLIKRGYDEDFSVSNHILQVYTKCSTLSEAYALSSRTSKMDVVSWTALMSMYVDKGQGHEAFEMLEEMQLQGVSADTFALVCGLRASSTIINPVKGQELHNEIVTKGFDSEPYICNSLVDMYAKCGLITEAENIFHNLVAPDVVSWTALIAGYIEHDCYDEASSYFEEMQLNGVSPDVVSWNAIISYHAEEEDIEKAYSLYTQMQEQGRAPSIAIFLSMLKACGNAAALDTGRKLHIYVSNFVLNGHDVFLTAALIDMYGKCGNMNDAQQVFNAAIKRDLVIWNAIIAGFTRQGENKIVLSLLKRMKEEGIDPDASSFVNALTACSHVGLVDMGETCFESMSKEYAIFPSISHYNCLIDILGRAGQMDKVLTIIDIMPFDADSVMWSTVLGACQKWGQIDVAHKAFKHAVRLCNKHAAMFILMSNISADTVSDDEEWISEDEYSKSEHRSMIETVVDVG